MVEWVPIKSKYKGIYKVNQLWFVSLVFVFEVVD